MRIADMNWMQVEEYLNTTTARACPGQHRAARLPEPERGQHPVRAGRPRRRRTARRAGLPRRRLRPDALLPRFPGSVTLRVETYMRLVRDILDSLWHSGFQRILFVNGHGGNSPAEALATEWMADHPDARGQVPQLVERAAHLGQGAGDRPRGSPCLVDGELPLDAPARRRDARHAEADGRLWRMLRLLPPAELRDYLGDGNFGGYYQRPDAEMLAIWEVAVDETRDLLAGSWANVGARSPAPATHRRIMRF